MQDLKLAQQILVLALCAMLAAGVLGLIMAALSSLGKAIYKWIRKL